MQPSLTLPLQLSSTEVVQISVGLGRCSPEHTPQTVPVPLEAAMQVCVPGRQMPTPCVPAGPV